LRFEILPVTKERYEPPAPSIGMKVKVSIIPTAQYIGAVAINPRSKPLGSGRALKIIPTAIGNISIIPSIEKFQALPHLCTRSI
jgi:hypothetical protein